MAEFVRIWDESIDNGDGTFGNYVEHDTTVIEKEIVGVPVIPVSITTNINKGVINKVIDTNEIIASTNIVDIAQIFRPVTVEKSYANRLTIETSLSKQVSIEASRNEIIINTSSKGQRGETGARGIDSVIDFEADLFYAVGKLALFGGKIWIAKEVLDGSENPIANPEENAYWSEILDLRDLTELPFTRGYEINSQEDWDTLEPILKLGDVIKVSDILPSGEDTLPVDLFNETIAREIVQLGGPLVTNSNNAQFFVTTRGSGGTTLVVSGSIFDPATGALEYYDVTKEDFIAALDETGIIYGEDKFTGNNSVLHIGANFGKETAGNAVFQILEVLQERTTAGNYAVRLVVSSESGTGGTSVLSGGNGDLNTRIFGVIPPGIAVEGKVTDLVVGDLIHVQGKKESTLQKILRVSITLNRTFYDIFDYEGFELGEFIIGEVKDFQLLSSGQWYGRNANVASNLNKLDPLATDQVVRSELDGLLDRVPTIDEGLLTKAQKDSTVNFLASNAKPYTLDDSRSMITAMKRIFGSSDTGLTSLPLTGIPLVFAGGQKFIGIQDGAQQNYIDVVEENSSENLYTTFTTEFINNKGRQVRTLHSNAENNRIQTVEAGGVLSIDSDRELSSVAETNKIDDIEANGVLSIDSDRILSSTAQVNVVNAVNGSSGSEFSFDTATKKLLIPNISISDTGGDGASGNLIKLDLNGLIPSDAIGKLNLSNVSVFKIIEERNSQAIATLPWATGDLAIVSGVPDLTVNTTIVSGGNSLVVNNTSDLYIPGTGETSTVFLSTSGGNFKEVEYSDNDTGTNTLTVVVAFTADDVTDFPIGTTVGVQTGTFVFFSEDQTTSATTVNSDWAEIVPSTGVVSSINGEAGVVTLTATKINHLNATSGVESIQIGINDIRQNIIDIKGYAGTASSGSVADGDFVAATGLTADVEDNHTDIDTLNGSIGTRKEKQDKLTTTQITSFTEGLNIGEVDSRVTSGITGKQDNLTAGTGLSINQDTNVISVQNASGIQVTAFKFERISGDEIRITKYENGDTIDPIDNNDTTIIYVDGLDTELYNIAGTCSVTDTEGNVVTNAQECENTFSGTWTINSGSAILQRIS